MCFVSETGSPISGTCVGLGSELYPEGGVAGKPIPGFNGQLLCWLFTVFSCTLQSVYMCEYADALIFVFCCIAVRVLRNDMSECATGELGNIVVKSVAHCC